MNRMREVLAAGLLVGVMGASGCSDSPERSPEAISPEQDMPPSTVGELPEMLSHVLLPGDIIQGIPIVSPQIGTEQVVTFTPTQNEAPEDIGLVLMGEGIGESLAEAIYPDEENITVGFLYTAFEGRIEMEGIIIRVDPETGALTMYERDEGSEVSESQIMMTSTEYAVSFTLNDDGSMTVYADGVSPFEHFESLLSEETAPSPVIS